MRFRWFRSRAFWLGGAGVGFPAVGVVDFEGAPLGGGVRGSAPLVDRADWGGLCGVELGPRTGLGEFRGQASGGDGRAGAAGEGLLGSGERGDSISSLRLHPLPMAGLGLPRRVGRTRVLAEPEVSVVRGHGLTRRNRPGTACSLLPLCCHSLLWSRARIRQQADEGKRQQAARSPWAAPYCWTNANLSSASEATSLPTMQRQRVWPIEPRILMTSASMWRVSPGSTGRRHLTESALMK